MHFAFHDYAKLTIVGVLIACVGWPVVTRISSAPRWLFFRLAILVTVVLLLPDAYILWQGQSAEGVAVLVSMHLAIALVTYNALVRIAPVGASRQPRRRTQDVRSRRACAGVGLGRGRPSRRSSPVSRHTSRSAGHASRG